MAFYEVTLQGDDPRMRGIGRRNFPIVVEADDVQYMSQDGLLLGVKFILNGAVTATFNGNSFVSAVLVPDPV